MSRRDKAKGRHDARRCCLRRKKGLENEAPFWFDIDDDAPRHKMVKAKNLRREQMIGDGLQLELDLDHWNSIHPREEPIVADLDLTDEVQWRKNAPGDADKKAG